MSVIISGTPTPYRALKNSALGKFVTDNKVTSGGVAVGSALAVTGAASQSKNFRWATEKVLVPGLGVAMTGFAGTMIHDAAVNDLGKGHNARGLGKAFVGTVLALGGTEIVGRSYEIPFLDQALSEPVKTAWKAIDGVFGGHWQKIGGVALAGTGAALVGTSIVGAANGGLKEKHVAGMAAGAAMVPGGVAVLGNSVEAYHIATTSSKVAGVIGGLGLVALAVTRAKAGYESFKNGSVVGTVGNGLLSVLLASGGTYVVGSAARIRTIMKIGDKIFEPLVTKGLWPAANWLVAHPIPTALMTLGAAGTAGYAYFKYGKKE